MLLLVGARLPYCATCGVWPMTCRIYRRLLYCLNRLDFKGLWCSERLDASSLDGNVEAELRSCSILILGATSSFLVKDLSCLCSPLVSLWLLLRVLLLLVFSCNVDSEVVYRSMFCRVSSLCAPRYVLIEKRMESYNLSMNTPFRRDLSLTWPQRSAFSHSTSE